MARSTIYRHWRDRLELIADAFEVLNVQPGEAPSAELAPRTADRVADRPPRRGVPRLTVGPCVPALIDGAERDGGLQRFLHDYSARRRGALTWAITRGIEVGEVRADLDAELAAVALAGAVLYLRTMTPHPLDPARAAELTDVVLGPRPAPQPTPEPACLRVCGHGGRRNTMWSSPHAGHVAQRPFGQTEG